MHIFTIKYDRGINIFQDEIANHQEELGTFSNGTYWRSEYDLRIVNPVPITKVNDGNFT